MSSWVWGAGAALIAAVGASLVAVAPAHALTCTAPAGAPAEITEVLGTEACGAHTDGLGGAFARGDGGVGFADSYGGATVGAAGAGGGVGAAEGHGALLGAFGSGEGALALGILDEPGVALVLAGPRSQAFIGDAADPVLCQGDTALAVNFTSARGCVVVGSFAYSTSPAPGDPLPVP